MMEANPNPDSSGPMMITTAHGDVGDADALKRLERFGGLKLREELTKLFLQEAPARIAAARAAHEGGDIVLVRSMAHALKSSAAQMGAPRVSSLCEQIEKQDPPSDLAHALSGLDEEFSRYCDWLSTAFPAPQSP